MVVMGMFNPMTLMVGVLIHLYSTIFVDDMMLQSFEKAIFVLKIWVAVLLCRVFPNGWTKIKVKLVYDPFHSVACGVEMAMKDLNKYQFIMKL